MARRAPTSVGRSEPDEKSATDHQNGAAHGQQARPAEEIGRHQSAEITHTSRRKSRSRARRNCRIGEAKQSRGDQGPGEDANEKRQVPQARVPPVVSEEFDATRGDGGTQMTKIARNTELPISEHEQRRNEEADERSGDVPRPRSCEHVEHEPPITPI